ncbi:MAG: hypothetical protein H7A41_02560 [Chlamydiales bacterium]|nr:hypothetical protein [Chlamydiales bacterium]
MLNRCLILIFLLPSISYASAAMTDEKIFPYEQWFTGPLFTPMAITPEKEHPALEVTFGGKCSYGFYNDNWQTKSTPNLWSIFNYYDAQLGISSILGLEIIASWTNNFSKGAYSVHIQDTTVRLGFQVCNEVPGTWIPDFRIILQEVFPTGNYQKLKPDKYLTDLTGQGTFQTGLYLAFQKLFDLNNGHKYQMRFSTGYFIPAPTQVSGINAYGGSLTTNGTVYPGHYISTFCSGEYNLNNRWALAFDSNFQYQFKGRFSGNPGTSPTTPLENAMFTLAPELEHTFSENSGMLLGAWFTILGKNTPAFSSLFFSLLFVF